VHCTSEVTLARQPSHVQGELSFRCGPAAAVSGHPYILSRITKSFGKSINLPTESDLLFPPPWPRPTPQEAPQERLGGSPADADRLAVEAQPY
jgi:hypothetical protein